eukprot:11846779-Karenia_brevis.AAC.1
MAQHSSNMAKHSPKMAKVGSAINILILDLSVGCPSNPKMVHLDPQSLNMGWLGGSKTLKI